jgi:hypothetical protein
MDVKTTRINEIRHMAVLSKREVEVILRDYFRKELNSTGGPMNVEFDWGYESTDSGLSKEPRIIIRAVEDVSKAPTAG